MGVAAGINPAIGNFARQPPTLRASTVTIDYTQPVWKLTTQIHSTRR